MADFNALEALINAHIKKNGVQAITGNILNGILRGMVSALGKGYTIAGVAVPSSDPGTMTGPLAYLAYTAGTYTHFGGLEVGQGEVSMLIYNEAEWHKEVLFSLAASATIDGNVGTPEVGVSFVDGLLTFDFRNMKGNPGDPAGFGTINATVDGNVGTPGVSVQSSGPDTAKNITFQFTNLKGETGVTSVVATVDNTVGTPTCTVSLVGQQLTLAFSGLKGAQGDTGSSVDYPFTIVNNLTTNDATQALSAAMGVQLEAEVSQLEAKVGDLSTGKYYGYFAQEEDLPEADVDGFAYVGEGPTYTIYNLRNGVWTSSDITVNQSPIGNDEDIDQNEDGKLQFANRTYNAQQPNGMGYKILRKNATFASQVTDTNTIYEIRYDFSLGGNSVTIPSGCVLKFNGGSVSNGIISLNGTIILSRGNGILRDIVLNGTLGNNFAEVDWFLTGNDASNILSIAESNGINKAYHFSAGTYEFNGTITQTLTKDLFWVGEDSTIIEINGSTTITQKGKLNIVCIEFRFNQFNTSPFIIAEGSSRSYFKSIKWVDGGTLIQMGTASSAAFNLRIENSRGLIVANEGHPFVILRNGAGFYWTTFDEIHHNEATTPTYNRTSVMNTLPGTDAILISGAWDTAHICFFSEKMYDAIHIKAASEISSQVTVQNIFVYNCVWDFCRNCCIDAELNLVSLSTFHINDSYLGSWENHSIFFDAQGGYTTDIHIVNNSFVYAGKCGIYHKSTTTALARSVVSKNIIMKWSRVDNSGNDWDAIFIYNLNMSVVTENEALYIGTVSSFPWYPSGQMTVVYFLGANVVSGNTFNSYQFAQIKMATSGYHDSLVANNNIQLRTGSLDYAFKTETITFDADNLSYTCLYNCKILFQWKNDPATSFANVKINGGYKDRTINPIILQSGDTIEVSLAYGVTSVSAVVLTLR